MRRFRTPSWVGGEKEKAAKAPKPIPPLRYRISPVEKELDRLDDLQIELEKQIDSIDPTDWAHLESILHHRRERAHKRRERDQGIKEHRTTAKAAKPLKTPDRRLPGDPPLFSNGVLWAFATFICFILFF